MTPRLSEQTAHRLPPAVERPGYDRACVDMGVVHIGIGAFHRAHQAVFFDRLLEKDPRWAIRAASLRSAAVREAMEPQDCLYCTVERDGDDERVRLVGSVRKVLLAGEETAALVEALAAPETHIVTLTVTEKGYRLDPASGALIVDDPDVVSDLSGLARPRTVPGFLAAALAVRRNRGLKPFTAISCDNLPQNGARLEAAVLAMARHRNPGLRDWIASRGAFPNTMVDRIVPATEEQDIQQLMKQTSLLDRAMVKTEPYLQWVIEDHFAGERPDLAAVGVQLTRNVAPWEEAKLRLLNGAHSTIAYLGGLMGCDHVHEFMARPLGSRLVDGLWDEVVTTLDPPEELDLGRYRAALMTRFRNAALRHRTRQIASDGSQKIPQRLLAPLIARETCALPSPILTLAVAAWMRWQEGRDERGCCFEVADPLAELTTAAIRDHAAAEDKVGALLSLSAIFPARLVYSERFRAEVTAQYHKLASFGAEAAMAEVVCAR